MIGIISFKFLDSYLYNGFKKLYRSERLAVSVANVKPIGE
nr:MAG TPA: hypothetical protein [Bacteriophage sp.]